jgi:hypothetical protein
MNEIFASALVEDVARTSHFTRVIFLMNETSSVL